MKLKGGFRTDERTVDVPNGSWVDARNILLQKGFESVSNENGNTVRHLLDGQLIIGVIPTSKDTSVIFSVGTNYSQIGILDSLNNYTTIIHDSQNLFKFSMLNPIEGVFKYNYKGDLIVAWCDGINSTSQNPKLLNLTDLPFAVTVAYELVNTTDIVLAYLFPNVIVPEITIDKVNTTGGQLKAGVYYFCIAYEIQNNDLTNFLQVSRPVSVADIVKTTTTPNIGDVTPFIYNDKAASVATSVSISLTVSNLDTTFEFFRLISISKLNGIIAAQEIGRFNTSSGTISYTYTGVETVTTLSIENILVNNLAFLKAKTMTDFQDCLYIGNTKVNNIKYQKFANNIKIKYSITNVPVVSPNTVIFEDLKDAVIYKSYQPEEVYGLYIHLILNDGSITGGYHIPGRQPRALRKILNRNITYTSWVNVAGNIHITSVGETNLSTYGAFLVIVINNNEYKVTTYNGSNTIILTGYGGTFAEPTAGTLNAYSNNNANSTEMENSLTTGSPFISTEEQLIDANLKFHQIFDTADEPDSNNQGLMGYWENENETYPNEDEYNGALDYSNNVIVNGRDLRGTKVKHHKMPSQNRINKISTGFDSLVIGIRFDNVVIPANIESEVQAYYISYVKRDFNNTTILANDILLKKYQNADSSNYTTMYNFALLAAKPVLNPTYLRHIYTINSGFVINKYPDFGNITTLGQTLRVNGLEYHPDNNSATIPDNTGRVENVSLKYTTTLPSESASPPFGTSFATDRDFNSTICIANLCNYVKDLYVSFYNQQELCSTGKLYYTNGSQLYTIFNGVVSDILFGGDTFLNDVHAKTDKYVAPYFLIMPYLCYSSFNIGLREKDAAWTSYYGNFYKYNRDFSSLLDLKQISSFNSYSPILDSFPFRVNKSNVANDESLTSGWRVFLANAYKEINKSKGEIWSLNKLNKELLIQAKYTLYIGKIKDTLNTNGTETYLGTSDVFDRDFDEIVSNEFGYVGSQSQWASFVCKIGYVCIDREQGKVFIYNGKILEISEIGNRNFFRTKLNTSVNIDNPFYIYSGAGGTTGGGLTAAYDEKNERIIICKKDISDLELSLTMSYSVRDNVWICKHDYFPNYIFSTRNKLFFVQNVIGATNKGRVIEHNVGNKGEFWNQTSFFKYKSYMDVVFKQPNIISKIFDSVNWKSEIIDTTGVNLKNKTITHIMLYNSTQCSGTITIDTSTGTWFKPNCTNVQETWKFNDYKDVIKDKTLPFLDNNNAIISTNINNNKNWFDKSLFIDKFVVVRFIYDNVVNNDIYISDVEMASRETNE